MLESLTKARFGTGYPLYAVPLYLIGGAYVHQHRVEFLHRSQRILSELAGPSAHMLSSLPAAAPDPALNRGTPPLRSFGRVASSACHMAADL
jgi:hypothetical protein